jgi:hypothetical protein
MADLLDQLRAEADRRPCHWGTADDEGRYPCTTHRGGFLAIGATYCSRSPSPFAEPERQAWAAFERECSIINAGLKEAPGWYFMGHDHRGYGAAGPVGTVARVEVFATTGIGLLASVSRLLERGTTKPVQGVLL